jgi:hypothetical protein
MTYFGHLNSYIEIQHIICSSTDASFMRKSDWTLRAKANFPPISILSFFPKHVNSVTPVSTLCDPHSRTRIPPAVHESQNELGPNPRGFWEWLSPLPRSGKRVFTFCSGQHRDQAAAFSAGCCWVRSIVHDASPPPPSRPPAAGCQENARWTDRRGTIPSRHVFPSRPTYSSALPFGARIRIFLAVFLITGLCAWMWLIWLWRVLGSSSLCFLGGRQICLSIKEGRIRIFLAVFGITGLCA